MCIRDDFLKKEHGLDCRVPKTQDGHDSLGSCYLHLMYSPQQRLEVSQVGHCGRLISQLRCWQVVNALEIGDLMTHLSSGAIDSSS